MARSPSPTSSIWLRTSTNQSPAPQPHSPLHKPPAPPRSPPIPKRIATTIITKNSSALPYALASSASTNNKIANRKSQIENHYNPPMHYLLTGGAGFIGSHLAERLLADGHSLTILDDFSTGREGNITHLRSNPELDVIRDTVENQQTATLLVSRADAIFHLAAAVGVKLVAEEPVR